MRALRDSPLLLAVTLCIVHIAVIALFTRGFLLTRVELPNVSSCEHGGCQHQQYTKAVIIIVDALRHDFMCPPPGVPKPHHGLLPLTLQRVALSVRCACLYDHAIAIAAVCLYGI